MREVVQKLVNILLFCFQILKLNTKDIITVLKDTLTTTSSPLPIPDLHVIGISSNTLERHSISSRVTNGVRNLVTSLTMLKLVGSLTFDSTFTYQKGVKNTPLVIYWKGAKNTSLADLLFSKGVMDSHSLHKVFHSFLKVVPSDGTFITTRVAIVNNIESAIQVGGHTPIVVLLDIGAQLVILGVQFAKKMGMLDSKLRKSMWQIRIINGSIKEVLGESSDLIALNFDEGINQELCLQVKCLITNATNYNVVIGQDAPFPPSFTIDN